MKLHLPTFLRSIAALLVAAAAARAADPQEPILEKLPPGVFLESSYLIPADQTNAIGKRLGTEITRLTNSVLRVQGRRIQLNVVIAADEVAAETLLKAFGKKPPFAFRTGSTVYEYAQPKGGAGIDSALALKTSFELGLVPKPDHVTYEVAIEVATVEEGDYMACNPLFNAFLALARGQAGAAENIEELQKRFTFGDVLALRKPNPGGAIVAIDPKPTALENIDSSNSRFQFEKLSQRNGVPFARVTMAVATDESGSTETGKAPGANLTAATKFWPADDPKIIEFAARITVGSAGNKEKTDAILKWISANLRYSGETGSRWGVAKVLEQKFGHCWDFSDCFVTLCRAAKVPSRQVAGWLFGSSGHVWAEYFVEGSGWQQVDPTGGGVLPCGIYHIPWFATESGEMPIVYLSMPQIRLHTSE